MKVEAWFIWSEIQYQEKQHQYISSKLLWAMQQQELWLRKHAKYKTCHLLEYIPSFLISLKNLHKIKAIISSLTYKNNIFRNVTCIKNLGIKMKGVSTRKCHNEEKKIISKFLCHIIWSKLRIAWQKRGRNEICIVSAVISVLNVMRRY